MVGRSDAVGQLIQLFLGLLVLVDDDGVVKVAALDEVGGQHHFHFTHETEGAGRSNLLFEVCHVVQRGELAAEDLGLEGNHGGDAERLVGQDGDDAACLVVAHFYFLVDDIEILGGILLHDAHASDVLYVFLGRTVEDGYLRAIDLDEAIVHAEGVEGSQCVLHGGAACFALSKDGAASGFDNVLGDGLDDGLAGEVYALDFVAVVFGGGVERNDEVQSSVEALAVKREATA